MAGEATPEQQQRAARIHFLIDECLSPALVALAHAFGHAAAHVNHRGWSGWPDARLLHRLLDEDLTLVTNNDRDFKPMLARTGLHPGVVVLPNVRRTVQLRLFGLALEAIHRPDLPLDMINTVVEVDASGSVSVLDLPPS
jgi:predicted nuclease of predicted toxin-antitoxin system